MPYGTSKKSFPMKLMVIALLVVVVSVSIPSLTRAADPEVAPKINWWNCVDSPVSCAIYGVTMAVNSFMQLFIALGAYLVRMVLSFGEGVVDLTAVQTGFSVSLAIANLGFVLGIIIIALSTILHRQTYGIKQILWKLVIAAILVNFGLSIAGAVLNVSDTFTNYFTAAVNGKENFVNQITAAFGANQLVAPPTPDGAVSTDFATCLERASKSSNPNLTVDAAACEKATRGLVQANTATQNPLLQDLDQFMKAVLALVFIIIFNFIIAFTLFALAVMLLIRFITIAFLLILLPLAWLMWIFPKFSHLNGQWWSSFWRWTFFPPLVTFFLYLAIMTSQHIPALPAQGTPLAGTPEAALGIMTNAPGPIGAASSEILIIGLALGGLFVANKMSITGASVAQGALRSVGNATKGYLGKQGAKAARATYRGAGGERLTKNLQQGNLGRFGRLPVIGGLARRGASIAGRGIANISDNEKMVKDATKKVPDNKEQWETELKGSMRNELRMAYLQKGQREGWVDAKTEVGVGGGKVVSADRYVRENKGTFHSYGQDGEDRLEENLRNETGVTFDELAVENEALMSKRAALQEKSNPARKRELEQIEADSQLNDKEKSELQEIRDKEKVKMGDKQRIGLSEKLQTRKDELEQIEAYDGLKDEEKKELQEIRDKEKSGLFLNDAEEQELKDTEEKLADNDAKTKKIMAKHPEVAADGFQDHAAARAKLEKAGRSIPITFEPESVKKVQAMFLRVFAEGFSPQNARSLIDAIAKKNNLAHFEGAMENLEGRDPRLANQIKELAKSNKVLADYIKFSPGQLFVDLNKMFGIKPATKTERKERGRAYYEEEEPDTQQQKPQETKPVAPITPPPPPPPPTSTTT
jgi:hypothetical protein